MFGTWTWASPVALSPPSGGDFQWGAVGGLALFSRICWEAVGLEGRKGRWGLSCCKQSEKDIAGAFCAQVKLTSSTSPCAISSGSFWRLKFVGAGSTALLTFFFACCTGRECQPLVPLWVGLGPAHGRWAPPLLPEPRACLFSGWLAGLAAQAVAQDSVLLQCLEAALMRAWSWNKVHQLC